MLAAIIISGTVIFAMYVLVHRYMHTCLYSACRYKIRYMGELCIACEYRYEYSSVYFLHSFLSLTYCSLWKHRYLLFSLEVCLKNPFFSFFADEQRSPFLLGYC